MNERCKRCHHSPASHDSWGHGACAARNCTCAEYVAPPLWADDATPEQIARAIASLSGSAR